MIYTVHEHPTPAIAVEINAKSVEDAAEQFTQEYLIPEMAYNDETFTLTVVDPDLDRFEVEVTVEMNAITEVIVS